MAFQFWGDLPTELKTMVLEKTDLPTLVNYAKTSYMNSALVEKHFFNSKKNIIMLDVQFLMVHVCKSDKVYISYIKNPNARPNRLCSCCAGWSMGCPHLNEPFIRMCPKNDMLKKILRMIKVRQAVIFCSLKTTYGRSKDQIFDTPEHHHKAKRVFEEVYDKKFTFDRMSLREYFNNSEPRPFWQSYTLLKMLFDTELDLDDLFLFNTSAENPWVKQSEIFD